MSPVAAVRDVPEITGETPQTLNTENSHFLQGTLWFPTSLAAPLGHLAEAGLEEPEVLSENQKQKRQVLMQKVLCYVIPMQVMIPM